MTVGEKEKAMKRFPAPKASDPDANDAAMTSAVE